MDFSLTYLTDTTSVVQLLFKISNAVPTAGRFFQFFFLYRFRQLQFEPGQLLQWKESTHLHLLSLINWNTCQSCQFPELLNEPQRDLSGPTVADHAPIHIGDRDDLRGRPREKHFITHIHMVRRKELFLH